MFVQKEDIPRGGTVFDSYTNNSGIFRRLLILPVALALCELLEREDCGSEEEEGEEGEGEGEGGTGVLVVSGLPLSDPPPTTGSVALTSERNTGLVPEFCQRNKEQEKP